MSAARRPLAAWLRDAWADREAGCPPPEAWLAAEQAALGADERERLQAHLAACPACRAESELAGAWDEGEAAADPVDVERVVAALRGEAREGAAASPVAAGNAAAGPVVILGERRSARRVPWTRLAAAAAVALGIGLAFQTLRAPAPPVAPSAGVARGGSLEALSPVGELAEIPGELRWEGGEAAWTYRVRLETVAGDLLWQAEATGEGTGMTSRIALPTEIEGRLQRAVTYRWTVLALDGQGRIVAASEPVAFRAAPSPEATAIPGTNGGLHP